jgi:hypothetical protein
MAPHDIYYQFEIAYNGGITFDGSRQRPHDFPFCFPFHLILAALVVLILLLAIMDTTLDRLLT